MIFSPTVCAPVRDQCVRTYMHCLKSAHPTACCLLTQLPWCFSTLPALVDQLVIQWYKGCRAGHDATHHQKEFLHVARKGVHWVILNALRQIQVQVPPHPDAGIILVWARNTHSCKWWLPHCEGGTHPRRKTGLVGIRCDDQFDWPTQVQV